MLIELTGREALPSGIALQTTAFNVGRVIGPLVGAWIISATGGEGAVFLVNGISFLFVIGGLLLAQTRYRIPPEANVQRNLRKEFKEGLRYIRSNSVVLSVILMVALVGFFGMPFIQQIPALARDVLVTNTNTETMVATRTSNLYAAQGVGALIAAFLAATLSASDKHKMLMLGQISFTIPIIALGFTRSLNVALALLALIGWGTVTQLVTMNTLVQTEVPDKLRGRVFSVYFWALQGVAPFGSIVIGSIAQRWQVPTAAVVAGTICLIGILLIRLTLRNGEKSSA
jgi:MFS family permease